MTNEQAIKVLLDEWKCIDRNDGINCDRQCEKCDLVMDSAILKDAYNMAIKALSQEPCDVAVSRILQRMWNCRSKQTTSIDKVKMEQIIREELPSVTHKSGKWIDREEYDADRWKCSICGRTEQYQERYCPNCGARMVEPQESEV